jgi:hypothetical protein
MTYLDYILHTLREADRIQHQHIWDLSKTYLLTLDGDVGFTYRDVDQVVIFFGTRFRLSKSHAFAKEPPLPSKLMSI